MFNITLTITAAPELLEVLSKLAAKDFSVQSTANMGQGFLINQMNGGNQSTRSKELSDKPIKVPVAKTSEASICPQTYNMEQLTVASAQIIDAGRRKELMDLLSSFGVQALSALSKEQYESFGAKLKELGAKTWKS